MKHKIILFALVGVAVFAAGKAHAAVSNWQSGASLVPKSTTDFSSSSFNQSLQNLAAAHANTAVFIIPYYQSGMNSSDIQAGWNTPTDSSLTTAIDYAHSLGLSVVLKPHLDCYCGGWRAQINASDRGSWFANYSAMLNHLGTIGQAHNVSEIVVGTELIDMASGDSNSDNTTQWQSMISSLRGVYNGKLTYSANWGASGFALEVPQIKFWGSLDQIGISAYYELPSGSNNPSDIESQWDRWNNSNIKPISQAYNKPVIFTEIGYKSISGARYQPWNSGAGGSYDPTEQANLYTALFEYWNNQSFMQGVYLWNWDTNPNYGGSGNTDYSPQNKPAQDVISSWFSGSGTGGGGQTGNLSFTSSAAVPATINANQSASITANIKNNSSSNASNLIVDTEVYNSSDSKVFQKFVSGQSIAAGQSKQFTSSWTPAAAGNYTVKIGIFNSDWSTNYSWNGSSAAFTVSDSGSGSGTTAGSLDIWWPSDGGTVSGTQPFKAMVENLDVSNYNMYWQVDGGQLNQMFNSTQDYPHKEVLVDLSGWNWKPSNNYALNFVAKNVNSNIIAQKSIGIHVNH
ncbi:MAG TPA: BsuPI-related putative proteinase inhibitor [Patescibacteria group bacterium]|nr:BsuPI-related putative proteinase inhibitor [Patescibacteria group bacterium]